MNLEGEYTFDGPREEVWDLVQDPEALAMALPGTQSLEKVGERSRLSFFKALPFSLKTSPTSCAESTNLR